MKHYIFYLPGLGDNYDRYRQGALNAWRFFGVEAILLPMDWYTQGTYEERFQQARQRISEVLSQKHRVTLIGESAGASMAINLFAELSEVTNLVTVAGVNTTTTPVANRTLQRAPAFAGARQEVSRSLSRIASERMRRVHTLSAKSDHVVGSAYSRIKGAHNHTLWSVGHLFTIALCLTLLSGYIIHLVKRD
jgi:pimeloyl-ACP methyl ester carboxylesterase